MKRFFLLGALVLGAAFTLSSPADAHYRGNNGHGRGWYRGDYDYTQGGIYRCAERGTCRQWKPDYNRYLCTAHTAQGDYFEAYGSSMYSTQIKALNKCKAAKTRSTCTAWICRQLDRYDG